MKQSDDTHVSIHVHLQHSFVVLCPEKRGGGEEEKKRPQLRVSPQPPSSALSPVVGAGQAVQGPPKAKTQKLGGEFSDTWGYLTGSF